ncbi:hypothetical protein VPH35_042560 [Triticum aestivum]
MVKGRMGSKSNQYESMSLVQVEGVNTKEDVAWYGVAAMEEASSALLCSPRDGTHYRYLWGKITSPHGNSRVVCAQFKSNLPAESMVSACPPLVFLMVLFC